MILYNNYTRYYHWRKLSKAYTGSPSIIYCRCMWIKKYFKYFYLKIWCFPSNVLLLFSFIFTFILLTIWNTLILYLIIPYGFHRGVILLFIISAKFSSWCHSASSILFLWVVSSVLWEFFFLLYFCVFIFGEGKGGKKRGRETSMCERNIIYWLLLVCPHLGTWPARNRTGDLSVCRTALNPLNHTSQGSVVFYGLGWSSILPEIIYLCFC